MLTADTTEARVSLPQVRIGSEMGQYCLDRVGGSAVCNADFPANVPAFGLPTRDFHVAWHERPNSAVAPALESRSIGVGNAPGSATRGWTFTRVTNNNVSVYVRGSGGVSNYAAPVAWDPNTGHDFCFEIVSGRLRVWVDGSAVITETPAADRLDDWYTSSTLNLVNDAGSGRQPNASISNLRFGTGPCP